MDAFSGLVEYRLTRDGKEVEVVTDQEKYLRYFRTPGRVRLDAIVQSGSGRCEPFIASKDIRVYQNAVTYIGDGRISIESGIQDVFERNHLLYVSYTGQTTISAMDNKDTVWSIIDQSDVFIVGSSDILGFFSDMVKLQKIKQLPFEKKRVYIISNFSRSFLSKVLASSLSQIGATKAFLITEDQFYGLITRVSLQHESAEDFVFGEELSYEKSKTVYSLSGFLEFLAYAGFSYQLLAFLLAITFIVLVLNILRQIVGFNVFGTYYPILFAITIISLGVYPAFIFMMIGFFSILFVNIFSKRIHLLLHAKRALLISIYIVLLLFVLGIDNYFELHVINYIIFDNSFIIFPIFITIILADKIFQEDIDIWSRVGFIDFLQYIIVTGIIYFLFEYRTLQYFLISYPDIIILVVILNILVGRYMGLQLFEYFRFSPLLRKLNEEE